METVELASTFEKTLKDLAHFLQLLTDKERFVIQKRFNLEGKKRYTLAEIGKMYSVTRERIRQIEFGALHKLRRNVGNTEMVKILKIVKGYLADAGGLLREDQLFDRVFTADFLKRYPISPNVLRLMMHLDPELEYTGNTIKYYPHVRLAKISAAAISDITDSAVEMLKKKGDVVPDRALEASLGKVLARHGVDGQFVNSTLAIDKRIKILPNAFGLFEWRHIHPRTLRDKIFYTLRRERTPLHFEEITRKIKEAHFDEKSVNLQAVHNELIRHDDFVLIGRGIYALKEWGYEPGKVADVVARILQKYGPLSRHEVLRRVLLERQVKKITILLALKNDRRFIRTGREQYALKR